MACGVYGPLIDVYLWALRVRIYMGHNIILYIHVSAQRLDALAAELRLHICVGMARYSCTVLGPW